MAVKTIKTTPQVLERVSIRWLPEPAYEDTKTVAINAGGYFMDLRVTEADKTVQWARAGERITLKQSPFTCKWTRIIDSFGSDQADEAEFSDLPNGDSLETGSFKKDGVNPVPYEEVWRDVNKAEDSGSIAWILQSTDGSTFVGKVGDIFMAMAQGKDGSFGVRQEVRDAKTGAWKNVFENGPTRAIPSNVDMSEIDAFVSSHRNGERDEEVRVGRRSYVIRGAGTIP